MKISQLASAAGVTAETVRYYQRIKLLRTPRREESSYRSYDENDVAHLLFIKRAQTLGFTLDEIAALLRLSTADCTEVEHVALERLKTVRIKMADLRRLERALETSIEACEKRQPHAGCPLIEALLEPPTQRGE